jgi:phosphoadenosine phosphosulfate reductase
MVPPTATILPSSPSSPASGPRSEPAAEVLPLDRHGEPLDLERALAQLAPLDAEGRLSWAYHTFGDGLVVTTSFGIQSAVLLHMVSRLSERISGPGIPVLWVDTGYLPAETYHYADLLQELLPINLQVVQAELSPARMEARHGRLWETGQVEDLQLYNRIRKVEPLDRALADLQTRCWASGVRGGQTDHRLTMRPIDPVRGRWSLRPLLEWSTRDVFYYMENNGLPQHPLFAKGYSTVGDWHTSGPDDGGLNGRSTRFGGLKQECGIHVGEGI